MDGHLLGQVHVQQLQGEESGGIAFGEPEGHGHGHLGAAGRGLALNWEDYLLQQQVDDYESEADTISTEHDEELYDYSLDDAGYMAETHAAYGYHHHDYNFGQEWMPEPGPSLERAPYTRVIRTNHSILTRPVDAGISSAAATVDVATREMANQLVTEAAVRAAAAAAATLHDDPTIDASEDVFPPGGIRDSTIASEVLHMVSQGREYTPLLPLGQQHPITPGAQLKELAEQEVSAGGTPYHEQDDFFLPRYTPRAACRDSFVNIPPPIPPVGPAFHTREGYTLGEDVEHTVESGRCLFARRLKDLVGLRKADAAEGRREGQTAHDPAAPSGPAPPPPQGRRGREDDGAWDGRDALKQQQQQQQQMAVSVKKLHITGPAGKAEKSVRMVKRRPVSLSKRGDAPNRDPKNVSFQSMAVHGRGAANRRRKASPGPLGQDGIRGISLSSGVAFSPRGGEKATDKQQADLQLRRGRPPLPPGVAPSTSRRGC